MPVVPDEKTARGARSARRSPPRDYPTFSFTWETPSRAVFNAVEDCVQRDASSHSSALHGPATDGLVLLAKMRRACQGRDSSRGIGDDLLFRLVTSPFASGSS